MVKSILLSHSLSRHVIRRLDPSKLTFESIFHPIEDLNVPFETGFNTIRQLALAKQRVFAKLFSKVRLVGSS